MAVDFVSTEAADAATAYTSIDGGKTFTAAEASLVVFPTIGTMGAAPLDFTGVAAGATAQYYLSVGGANSSIYEVTPIVARPEVFAVFGCVKARPAACMLQPSPQLTLSPCHLFLLDSQGFWPDQ